MEYQRDTLLNRLRLRGKTPEDKKLLTKLATDLATYGKQIYQQVYLRPIEITYTEQTEIDSILFEILTEEEIYQRVKKRKEGKIEIINIKDTKKAQQNLKQIVNELEPPLKPIDTDKELEK